MAKKDMDPALAAALNEMLKEEDNKYCADCKIKGPRWASINLGVFICIRCSGIHRSLGTHISKVRSTNLDSWSADQVRAMQEMGNKKAAEIWEYSLPADFKRPGEHDSYAAESFIKAKYVRGQWKRQASDADRPAPRPAAEPVSRPAAPVKPATQPMPAARPEPSVERSRPAAAKPTVSAPPTKEIDLLSMNDPVQEFAQAPKPAAVSASAPVSAGASVLGMLGTSAAPDTTSTKDAILAMYGAAPTVAPAMPMGAGGFTPNYDVSMGPQRRPMPMGMAPMGMYPPMGMAPMGMGMMPMGAVPMGAVPMGLGGAPAGRGVAPGTQQPKWG